MTRTRHQRQAGTTATPPGKTPPRFDPEPNPVPEDPTLARVRALDPRKVRLVFALIMAALAALIFLPPRQPPPPASPAQEGTVVLDKAGLVSAAFARDTSIRLYDIGLYEAVIYIDRRPPEGALQPWTVQTASEWRVGTDRADRGLVLFVFTEPRLLRVEIGYGLEGPLPDARMRQLLEARVVPEFAQGRYEQGLDAFVEGIYRELGGDAAWRDLAHANSGQGSGGWAETWELAWRNGPGLLPAVWREYMQGNAMERFGILVFASIPTFFLIAGLTLLAITGRRLIELPGKLRARREHAAQKAAEDARAAASAPPGAGKRRRKHDMATVAGYSAWKAEQAAARERERQLDPGWFEIVMGPPMVLFCLSVVVFVFSMMPERFTRQGRFGGGGVEVTWPAPPR